MKKNNMKNLLKRFLVVGILIHEYSGAMNKQLYAYKAQNISRVKTLCIIMTIYSTLNRHC